MAEPIGIAFSALSIAGIFKSCVGCFEYIQLGRSFGRDYTTCQLRLDAAQLRLSRWGEAVKIHDDPRFTAIVADGDQETKLAASFFEAIQHLTQGVQMTSMRYELANATADLSIFSDEDMTPVGRRLHNRIAALSRDRQRSTSALRKTTWALYDGPQLDIMISQITSLIDELEKFFPAEAACRGLIEAELEGINDGPSLETLSIASNRTDALLAEAVAARISQIFGTNSAETISTNEQGDVQVGNRYSDHTMQLGRLHGADRTANSGGKIDAQGTSRVQIGNRFGSFAF
jgi:hypothetical protein